MALYLVHFSRPMAGGRHPQHYLGSTDRDPEERFQDHISGKNRPARIIQAALEQGIEVTLVRTWPELGYDEEKRLKKKIKKGFRTLCPSCTKGESCTS